MSLPLPSSVKREPLVPGHPRGTGQTKGGRRWLLIACGTLLAAALFFSVSDPRIPATALSLGTLFGLLLGLTIGGVLLGREQHRTRHAQAERDMTYGVVAIQQALFTLDMDRLLHQLADAVIQAVPCRGVGVLLFAPQSREVERVAVAGQIPTTRLDDFCRTLATAQPLTTALERGPAVLNSLQDIRRQFPALHLKEVVHKNLLIVPVQRRQLAGLLVVADTQHGTQFSAREVRLLTTAGAQAAVAIEHARTFAGVQATAAQRQELLRALMAAHERERKRVAAEWHERFGEKLFQVLRDFRACHELIVQRVPEGKERFEKLAGEVDAMAALVRSFTNELHPPVLDDFGFVAALREYVARLREQERFRVTVHADDVNSPLPTEANLGLFRILQEAVLNIRKHARANNVQIAFTQEHSGVSLMIKDDGQGFNPDRLPQGYGLLYMRERAEACGGTLRVVSARGQGTEVRVDLPRGEKTVVQLTQRAHSL